MVHSKADRERKKQTEKCQSQIEALLRLADNKYCVDCDSKGPRWSSWNLGIFLCIRCAGIHRNLGVHISRVKSVNLDAWSPEQVERVEQMGNSKARAIYEANLPEDFRRPQTDTALESFIRAKYEHKKYISHDFVEGQQQQPQKQEQPQPTVQQPRQKQPNLLAMDDDDDEAEVVKVPEKNDQVNIGADLSTLSFGPAIVPLTPPPTSVAHKDLKKLQDTIPTTNDLINFE